LAGLLREASAIIALGDRDELAIRRNFSHFQLPEVFSFF
jgi:hypothetical protein